MIKCPVCYGRGRVPVNFYGEQTQTTNCCEPTCKSCNGTGIVMEYQPLNNDLQDRLDQANKVIQKQQERIKELENNQVKRSPTELFREILTELEKESDKIPSYTQLETKVKDLQQKLDKAVEIIKSCNDGFVNCVRTEIEQFLADIKDKEKTNE
jgi:predicted nuclease with TOPRIM domain